MATDTKPTEEKTLATRPVEVDALHVVERALAKFPDSEFNKLVPSVIQEISALMRPQVVAIRINPDPTAGDVYPTPGGRGLSLHKLALDKIAVAVGISWTESRRSDDRKDPLYIEWQAKGTWTLPTGEKGDLVGTYDMDLHDNGAVYQDLLREQLARKSQAEAEKAARERLTTMRRRMAALAESGAKNRAVRSIGIKSSYSAAELARPFVAVRFVENIEDPDVKAAVLDRMRGRVVEVYGQRVPEEQAPKELAAEGPQDGEFHEIEMPGPRAEDAEPAIPDDDAKPEPVTDVAVITRDVRLAADAMEKERLQSATDEQLTQLGVGLRDFLGLKGKITGPQASDLRLAVIRAFLGDDLPSSRAAHRAGVLVLLRMLKDPEGQRRIRIVAEAAKAVQ